MNNYDFLELISFIVHTLGSLLFLPEGMSNMNTSHLGWDLFGVWSTCSHLLGSCSWFFTQAWGSWESTNSAVPLAWDSCSNCAVVSSGSLNFSPVFWGILNQNPLFGSVTKSSISFGATFDPRALTNILKSHDPPRTYICHLCLKSHFLHPYTPSSSEQSTTSLGT